MSARKNRPNQDGDIILPGAKELPQDDGKRSRFLLDLAESVVRSADLVGDYVRITVGKELRMVKISEAVDETLEMLYSYYRLGSPEPVEHRVFTIGLGLQYA